jgi:serine/threonine-protein kinase
LNHGRPPGKERAIRRSRLDETVVDGVSGGGGLEEELRPAASDRLIGRRVGAYRIESVLGRGSMASVYKAKHLGLERHCALKVMDAEVVARQPWIREQFWAEARAAANLVHPHIVTVHNLGSVGGYHFIEMEFVPGGQTLRALLVREGPLEAGRATRLARQVVQALGVAHESGLVHRDIKPANVLLTQQGDAKLADFGLVGRLDELASIGGPIAGTPTFMAPELFQGTPASALSDIYAVGVLLFHSLSGRLPFAAESVGGLIQLHRSQPVPEIRSLVPAVPEELAGIVGRCLAKSPVDRFASAGALAEALELALARLRDTETLIRESTHGLDCLIQVCRDTFRVIMSLPDNRLQEVVIEMFEDKRGERFLSVFSVCGPAEPAYYEYALKINSHLTYGSISVHDVLGTPMFVMSRTFARDSVRPEELRQALIEIARRSDRIEKQITCMDQY